MDDAEGVLRQYRHRFRMANLFQQYLNATTPSAICLQYPNRTRLLQIIAE